MIGVLTQKNLCSSIDDSSDPARQMWSFADLEVPSKVVNLFTTNDSRERGVITVSDGHAVIVGSELVV